MPDNKLTSKNYFRATAILHGAMVAGTLMFGLIITFLIAIRKNQTTDGGLYTAFLYLVPIVTVAAFFASNFIFKKQVKALVDGDDLTVKMNAYRGLLIVRYALVEGAGMLAIIVAFVLNDLFFLVFAALVILAMIYIRPTLAGAIKDLQLSEQEQMIVEDPEGIIDNDPPVR